MFYYGENTLEKPNDYRPEVHDSDGVFMTRHQQPPIWHLLSNPVSPSRHVFEADSLSGYGLLQRDRDFSHYEDIEAAYHRRPHGWVRPRKLPPGKVVLYTYPTRGETEDNVVLLYQPDAPIPPGQPFPWNTS